jgi:hypothetical protein
MIVPGGGLSEDGSRWVSSRPGSLVHVNLLSRLFRGQFLTMLIKAHAQTVSSSSMTTQRSPTNERSSDSWRRCGTSNGPFAGPEQVLRYLSRCTYRVAISNRRLLSIADGGVALAGKTTASTDPNAGRR